ncbi:MAG: hypothetical protein D4R84_18205 [Rhodocyclaceae bacterium]|nr:MAG: hypothetical protein D4R84_18205 [Rhodocyclaceae bacterium]
MTIPIYRCAHVFWPKQDRNYSAAGQPGWIAASDPLTAQTLTLQNVQIPATDLSGIVGATFFLGYGNGRKIADIPYASGYGEPFGIAFRSFAKPIKVNSFSVTRALPADRDTKGYNRVTLYFFH